jgi:UDP-N-acetylmuramoyl-tripeptide--D-alanyl-D-alanine ligase
VSLSQTARRLWEVIPEGPIKAAIRQVHGLRPFLRRVRWRVRHWPAACRRGMLKGVVFVAVTGSGGKTTAKDLIAAVLSTQFRGVKSPGQSNRIEEVPQTIFRVRRSHDFCVQELGAWGPGSLDASIDLLRPSIAVVTNIAADHRAAFRTLETTAEEKGKVIARLPPTGTAVLNADDPLVLAMRSRCRARVITFGLGPDAEVRAEGVQSVWPDRLAFTARVGAESLRVQTRLCGTHWMPSVLAALAVGLAKGCRWRWPRRRSERSSPGRDA